MKPIKMVKICTWTLVACILFMTGFNQLHSFTKNVEPFDIIEQLESTKLNESLNSQITESIIPSVFRLTIKTNMHSESISLQSILSLHKTDVLLI